LVNGFLIGFVFQRYGYKYSETLLNVWKRSRIWAS